MSSGAKKRVPSRTAKRSVASPTPAVWTAVAAVSIAGVVGIARWGVTPWTDLPMLALGVAGVTLGAVALLLLMRSGDARTAAGWRVGAAFAALAVSGLVSTVLSPHRWSAVFGMSNSSEGLIQMVALAALVVAGAFSSARLRTALTAIAPYVIVAQAVGVGVQLSRGHHPAGTLFNSTFMAQWVLLALPLVLPDAFDAQDAPLTLRRAWPQWSLVTLGLLTLAVSDALNATVAAVVWLVWLWWRLGRASRHGSAAKARSPFGAIPVWAWVAGGVAAVAAGWRLLDPAVWSNFLVFRRLYWVSAWRVLMDSPVIGSGLDTFRAAAAAYAPADMLETGVSGIGRGFMQLTLDPHNIFVWVGVYLGVVGVVLAGWTVFEIVRNWRRQSIAGGGVNWWAAAAVLYAASLLTAPAPLQTLTFLALVLAASLRPERADARPAVASAMRIGVTGLLITGGVASLIVGLLGLTHLSLGDRWGATTPADASAARSVAAIWMVDPYLHYVASWRTAAAGVAADAQTTDLASMKRAVELAPRDPVYALEYARTLASYGMDDRATREAYLRAIELFPASFDSNAGYARYLVRRGAPQDALRYSEAALAIGPREPDAHTVAAEVHTALGHADVAASHKRVAAKLQAARDKELERIGITGP